MLATPSPRTPADSAAFRAYYESNGFTELRPMIETLQRPLPLDVRVSSRAPLAGRALSLLRELQQENPELGDELYLDWASTHQWPAPSQPARRFLQSQQQRGALQRQESASMLPALLLSPTSEHVVLDMCAAPGSKSIQMLAQMEATLPPGTSDIGSGGGMLIANDASLDRTISLTHRLSSVNVASPHAVITSLDGRWWPPQLRLRFDRVLCDVPCSGDGTLRKRHKNTPEWDPSFAESLHTTQVGLLRQGLRQLKVGGLLAYSTCSFNPLENEAVVCAALRAMPSRTAFALEDPRRTHPHLFRNGQGRGGGGAEDDAEADGEADDADENAPSREERRSDGLFAAAGLTDWRVPTDGVESLRPPPSEAAGGAEAWIAQMLPRCVRLLPHRDDCGGFFVAVFRRLEETEEAPRASDAPPPTPVVATGRGDGLGEGRGDGQGDGQGVDSGKLEASPPQPGTAATEDGVPVATEDGDPAGRPSGSRSSSSSSYAGDASSLVPMETDSAEWRETLRFYGLRADSRGGLPGQRILWAPGRAAKREKLYLSSDSAARLVSEQWARAAATPAGAKRLRGRIHAVGVKAFERLKVRAKAKPQNEAANGRRAAACPPTHRPLPVSYPGTDVRKRISLLFSCGFSCARPSLRSRPLQLTNMRSKAAYTCEWRPCQQALHYLLPRMTRRVLTTSDEGAFTSLLRARGMRNEQLDALQGMETCREGDGQLIPGGAVLSLLRPPAQGAGLLDLQSKDHLDDDTTTPLASVACVLSPGGLSVWAPKEEVAGMLALLDGDPEI